jgi:hypothetical protein
MLVNAEVSGGGFPGWLSRTSDILRTNQSGYLEATQNYVTNIGRYVVVESIGCWIDTQHGAGSLRTLKSPTADR